MASEPGVGLVYWGWRQQPIFQGRKLLVALDGRIYNADSWPALSGDAELIATLYERHGFHGALERLNGDFAIALFDVEREQLWLGRDRFGIKPLYFSLVQGGIAFASRPSVLLGLPGVNRELDRRFIAVFAGSHYRTFDVEPGDSPYVAVKQLPAATTLRWNEGTTSLSPYWSLHEQPDRTEDEHSLASDYRELLLDAVHIRHRIAENPAFTLSGGMDSSSVLACAVTTGGHKQIATSSLYEDSTFDETDEIRSMLDSYVAEWKPVTIGIPDVAKTLERMIAANDEPVATATWLSHYLLCESIGGAGHRWLFGGLGGDELNAGEYEYFHYFFADLKRSEPGRLPQEIAKWVEYHDHPIFRKDETVVESALQRLVDLRTPGLCLPDQARLTRYVDCVNPEYFDLPAYRPAMDHPFQSYLKNRTYQDIYRETAPCCLRAADRQAVAFGMEPCWPFFDHRLVEFMFRIPGTMKIRHGVTKHLLRLAMKGVLPDETRLRIKKTGWNAPAHIWFSGDGRTLLLDTVHSQRFRNRGIYDVDRVIEKIEEHERIVREGLTQDNHMMFLWQLVNLELWFQSLERTPSGSPVGSLV